MNCNIKYILGILFFYSIQILVAQDVVSNEGSNLEEAYLKKYTNLHAKLKNTDSKIISDTSVPVFKKYTSLHSEKEIEVYQKNIDTPEVKKKELIKALKVEVAQNSEQNKVEETQDSIVQKQIKPETVTSTAVDLENPEKELVQEIEENIPKERTLTAEEIKVLINSNSNSENSEILATEGDTIFQKLNTKELSSLDVLNKYNPLAMEEIKFIYEDVPTDTIKARLERLNAKTPFNIAYNPSLESVIKNYLKNRHESLEKLMSLSKYYFPMFEEALDRHNLPLEIKYLAIIESALKPRAKSRVGATGLWQFMYGTGKMYGLNISSYVDERMDPVKATDASARYLSKLYKTFDDWDLALAAYNSGPGNVSKAIRNSGGHKNYWNLRPFLPRETAGYLPAFLATMYIFEYAHLHQFTPKPAEYNYYETDTVSVKQMISLKHVSESLKMDMSTLQFLNPQYRYDVIPVIHKEQHKLRLPAHKIDLFESNKDQIYAKANEEKDKLEKPLANVFNSKKGRKINYRIRRGDNLGSIARKFRVRVSQLRQWNNLRGNNIREGKTLRIYSGKAVARNNTKSKIALKSGESIYTVKSGDSLWSIANKYVGVSVENIKKWNNISGSSLKPGMRLKLKRI